MKTQNRSKTEMKKNQMVVGELAGPVHIPKRNILTWFIVAMFIMIASFPAIAQIPAIRYSVSQVRVTVPINSTNSTTITNSIDLVNGATNADFDVSGVPEGATVELTDTNFNPVTSITGDGNLLLTINTTNLAEGVYTVWLNASGLDTNGAPVTNTFPFVIQAAHIWNGSLGVAGNWSDPSSWFGGVPGAGDDVVFTDIGTQTNYFGDTTGRPFTNSFVDTDITIGSLRFSQTGLTNSIATNPPPYYHSVQIAAGKTLNITGTNGFSVLRDYLDDLAGLGFIEVDISGGAGSKMIVNNSSANFAMLLANQSQANLNMTNLDYMAITASRVGLGEYQLYPYYREINNALNAGRGINNYGGRPRNFAVNVYWPKTNIIKALYQDPDNYTNEFTRGYALSLMNNEQNGNGSSVTTFFQLGLSNMFLMDSVCFYGASSAAGNGNGAGVHFGLSNSVALFRGADGTSRMSVFTVSDDGGTNEAASNVKGRVDFAANNGMVNMLADRLYLARDREMIGTNQTPNVQADLTIGRGIVDVNTAVLGFQEHTKPDWTLIGGGDPYLNYCQGRLIVTNGGTFRVNDTLTLGYTADTNSSVDAQQFNTYGQITIYEDSVVAANNIVVDGGLNFYDEVEGRQNRITINSFGTLVVTNVIGGPNFTGSQYPTFANQGSPGLPLDTLTMSPSSVLTLFVEPGKTNVYVRNFVSTGIAPGTIKIASLPSFPIYPTNITLIKYQTASPILQADMSAVGGSVQGYILNNSANSTIDLFLTTNAPQTLVWTGNANDQWDLSSLNWVPQGGGPATAYAMGDVAVFDDSSTVTNVKITEVVVPNQATTGVIISNSSHVYTFDPLGGSIAGTAKVIKQGTNLVVFNAVESGPITITAGRMDVSGGLGSATLFSDTALNILGSATVNGVTATNSAVTAAGGTAINGSLILQGGSFVNSGTVTVGSGSFTVDGNAVVTNNVDGTINLDNKTGGGASGYEVFEGSTFANFGVITAPKGRLFIRGLFFGTGLFFDPVTSDPTSGNLARFNIRNAPEAVLSPGSAPNNSIGDMFMGVRVDLHESNPQNKAGKFLVEVDTVNHVNDTITAERWNNIGCIWVMTNINGTFSSGQSFRVLVNANGTDLRNLVDTADLWPLVQPVVPGPGLQWNLTDLEPYGIIAVTNSTMIWDGNGSATWDSSSTGNWQSGKVYGDNQGAIFDDTATGSTDITLTEMVAPAGFNIVEAMTNFVTNLDMTVTTNITPQMSNAPSFLPGIVVNNDTKDYTMRGDGRITGMTSIYKTGPGTLTLLNTNDFTGGMVIEGGTVAVTNIVALGFQGNIKGQRPAYNQIIIDNGTLKDFGTINQSLGWALTFGQNGATFDISSNEMNLNKQVIGEGGLTKTGSGTLILSQSSDIYEGDTIINDGAIRLTAAAVGFGDVTLNNSAELQVLNSFTFTNDINIAGPNTTISLQDDKTHLFNSSWSGAGNVTINSTDANSLLVFNGDISGLSGTVSFGTSIGSFRFNNRTNDSPCTGSASATFDLGTGSATLYNLNPTVQTFDLGGLAGGINTTLSGSATNGGASATTYSIGANNSDTAFFGKITDGVDVVSVVKVGSGTLALNGINTYTGSTTVSNGVLSGFGSIAGPLTVTTGGTLAPGSPVGTLTVSNTATLAGNVVMELNQGVSAKNDQLVVTGTITATGTLVVTNVGPDIANGTTFQLFNKAVTGFSSVTLPASNPSNTSTYTWNNNIGVDGSIQLISGGSSVSSNPTNLVVNVTGNTLNLSWPADHTGWILQAQTNTLGMGLQTNSSAWFDVPGSELMNQTNFTINPTNAAVFYRLILP